ncbi:putative response regulator receiver protein [Monocercomonoides exilis]|uniref:putative response regulator receiver protein n=1 Tax=Monocercomonoides exilis TaxID=2049356 RepID=UPI00355986B1|nr:putative response regulator receiver protein [Monocercomonoides exilis]|eukprot:MONOS_9071.1-p1 / transcript=MONOS_9071.1 / gene=MONOS_9071 / organism=Monocercomonoides_exilis_PA203 / gene_product=response regulator receiver protein / transcript_product=response regulator receiver protein / location=Mono_scaffold00362:18471-24265(-) / protein_length=1873 / sequence_SO=supercontig / SO=protein_coding / is_pseudo=false
MATFQSTQSNVFTAETSTLIASALWSTPVGWNLIGHSENDGNPNNLMQFRVTDVLLVASPYELFLMEEEKILDDGENLDLLRRNIRNADIVFQNTPFITRVSTLARALEAIKKRKFDLIITLSQFNDTGMVKIVSTLRKAAGSDVPLFPLVTTLLPDVVDFSQLSNPLPSSQENSAKDSDDLISTSPPPIIHPDAHIRSHSIIPALNSSSSSTSTLITPLHPYGSHSPAVGPLIIPEPWEYHGEAYIFSTLMSLVEDAMNIEEDTVLGVGVIVYVEHNPHFYSYFLPLIYHILTTQKYSGGDPGRMSRTPSTHVTPSYTNPSTFSTPSHNYEFTPPQLQYSPSSHHPSQTSEASPFRRAARPKVLHCRTFEEGWIMIERFRESVIALICDVDLLCSDPHNVNSVASTPSDQSSPSSSPSSNAAWDNNLRHGAGFELKQLLGERGAVLFLTTSQSVCHPQLSLDNNGKGGRWTSEGGVVSSIRIARKQDKAIRHVLREFMEVYVGLGNFVFRDPETQEVYRQASSMDELFEILKTAPAKIVAKHSLRNDFSTWLFAHGEYGLARLLRMVSAGNAIFTSGKTLEERVDRMRAFLAETYRQYKAKHTMGIARPFSLDILHHETNFFLRIGNGSMGGKARGLLFLERLLAVRKHYFAGYNVRLPKTMVLCSDMFEMFVKENDLEFLSRNEEIDVEELEKRVKEEEVKESGISAAEAEKAGNDETKALSTLVGAMSISPSTPNAASSSSSSSSLSPSPFAAPVPKQPAPSFPFPASTSPSLPYTSTPSAALSPSPEPFPSPVFPLLNSQSSPSNASSPLTSSPSSAQLSSRRRCTDAEVAQLFLKGRMNPVLVKQLREFLLCVHAPLAVRSSGLLEDSRHQPLAGIYATHMIPNKAKRKKASSSSSSAEDEYEDDIDTRLDHLCRAIKLVWASTYYENARSYLSVVGFSPSSERMSVILQEVVGVAHNDSRYYPDVSGVVQSINYYAIEGMKADDGLCTIALGLGKTVVDGGSCYRFSLGRPSVSYLFEKTDYLLKTQKEFYAVNLKGDGSVPTMDEGTNLGKYTLDDAEEDGTLQGIGSVYDMDDQRIKDYISGDKYRCPRILTFNRLLKYSTPIVSSSSPSASNVAPVPSSSAYSSVSSSFLSGRIQMSQFGYASPSSAVSAPALSSLVQQSSSQPGLTASTSGVVSSTSPMNFSALSSQKFQSPLASPSQRPADDSSYNSSFSLSDGDAPISIQQRPHLPQMSFAFRQKAAAAAATPTFPRSSLSASSSSSYSSTSALPLPSILMSVMRIAEWGMAGPVEMEFAANLSSKPSELVLLQLRPMLGPSGGAEGTSLKQIVETAPVQRAVARSNVCLGHGRTEGIRDILFVRPTTFDKMKTKEMAAEISEFNRKFLSGPRKIPFAAIGLGRWGTSSPSLGMPLEWPQICGARVLIETGLPSFHIEPSLGTHFMHNVMGLRIPFLYIPPSLPDTKQNAQTGTSSSSSSSSSSTSSENAIASSSSARKQSVYIDWEWLMQQEVVEEKEFTVWCRTKDPITVVVDGESKKGVVLCGARDTKEADDSKCEETTPNAKEASNAGSPSADIPSNSKDGHRKEEVELEESESSSGIDEELGSIDSESCSSFGSSNCEDSEYSDSNKLEKIIVCNCSDCASAPITQPDAIPTMQSQDDIQFTELSSSQRDCTTPPVAFIVPSSDSSALPLLQHNSNSSKQQNQSEFHRHHHRHHHHHHSHKKDQRNMIPISSSLPVDPSETANMNPASSPSIFFSSIQSLQSSSNTPDLVIIPSSGSDSSSTNSLTSSTSATSTIQVPQQPKNQVITPDQLQSSSAGSSLTSGASASPSSSTSFSLTTFLAKSDDSGAQDPLSLKNMLPSHDFVFH